MAGKFITFEGGEGTGKTTQIQLLADFLKSKNISVQLTREPGGSPLAEEIRKLVLNKNEEGDGITEALLITAARRNHWQKIIQPSLNQGRWVLCDRFSDSTMAYQSHGRGVAPEIIIQLNRWVLGDAKPDLTFILDLEATKALTRRKNRFKKQKDDIFEELSTEFHDKIRKAFLDIAQTDLSRYIVIDADAKINEISKIIQNAVTKRWQNAIT